MSYAELKQHSRQLRASGFDVVEHEVGVARKLAYPFVTVIMTLIAVPFAITLGRSGTMAGLAAGIGLAIVYWGTINFAAALGAGGALAPMLAAWAPNMLFGAGAAYLLLTVRT
jgi:lipopolysaccharide export LptBFGC system permease protein LptF